MGSALRGDAGPFKSSFRDIFGVSSRLSVMFCGVCCFVGAGAGVVGTVGGGLVSDS
jgi:hypothetical protein